MSFNSFDLSKFSEGINHVDEDSLSQLFWYAYMCSENCPLFKANPDDNFEVPKRDIWADVYRCAYIRWSLCFNQETLEPLDEYYEQLSFGEYDTLVMALNKGIWWKVWGK
jgi:hypothetical protein